MQLFAIWPRIIQLSDIDSVHNNEQLCPKSKSIEMFRLNGKFDNGKNIQQARNAYGKNKSKIYTEKGKKHRMRK